MLLLETLGGATSLIVPPFSTTMTVSDDGRNDDLATTTAISYIATSIGANIYSHSEDLKQVRDTMAYVESLDQSELEYLDNLLAEKELEFEMIEPTTDTDLPKVYIKNCTNNQ